MDTAHPAPVHPRPDGHRAPIGGPRRKSAAAPVDRDARIFDAAALALILVLGLLITLSGVRTGWKPMDADELVYRRTLEAMQHGANFYHAQRAALILKEHRAPTSIRAIRPPTLYLVLRWFPEGAWRWLVGLVYLADLLLVWRLARRYGPLAGVASVVLSAVWLFGYTSYLFLHAEVWGLPLFLGGALALRSHRVRAAVVLFAAATCVRELYVVGLLIGVALEAAPIVRASARSWRHVLHRLGPWLAGLAATAVLYGFHALMSAGVLSAQGYNARFGNEHRTVAFLLRLGSPFVTGWGEVFGLAVTLLGAVGAVRVARRDPAAVVCGGGGVILLVAAVWATRVYWSACWALPLAVFAPALFGAHGRSRRVPTGVGARSSPSLDHPAVHPDQSATRHGVDRMTTDGGLDCPRRREAALARERSGGTVLPR